MNILFKYSFSTSITKAINYRLLTVYFIDEFRSFPEFKIVKV